MLRLTLQALKVAAIATVALLTLFFGQRLFTSSLDRARAGDTRPVLFTIAQDESSDAVAQRLTDLKLINSGTYFKAKLRLRGAETQFVPGAHTLRNGMSVDANPRLDHGGVERGPRDPARDLLRGVPHP